METRDELLRELNRTDERTLALLADLDDRQLQVPYERGINPPIWELGHAAFFYEYFLLRPLVDATPRMPGFDEIWDSFEIQHRVRWEEGVVPGKETALGYYHRILGELREVVETRELDARQRYLCQYAIFHQNMHIESLIWCRQTLSYPVPPFWMEGAPPKGEPVEPGDVEIPAGSYPMGSTEAPEEVGCFSFDNERPGFSKELEAFRVSRTLVSNGAYLDFVEDGGYEDESCWSFGGRCWKQETKAAHPVYWRKGEEGWEGRSFDRWSKIDPDAPVLHVSFWEAEAYCRWAGRRLPTEFEWEAAARGEEGRRFPWGDDMEPERVNMDGRWFGRPAVTAFPRGTTPGGCLQMLGTAWEWTSSQYLPYDGFSMDMYPYMSILQFGDHKTTRGGSCATSSCLIRSSYRQAYLPGRTDVFVGFRTCAC